MKRYNRNMIIEGFGPEGQEKLKKAKVLVIGAGGLGSPILYYLAAAGIGTLGILDDDTVDITNLQRQILHRTADLGKLKVLSAQEKLLALNPETRIITHRERFSADNASHIIHDYAFIMDATDNYETKFLINDVCVQEKKPYTHGAILAIQGEAMTYVPGNACYRCIFENPPEEGSAKTASEAGALGAMAGIIGSIQAAEAIKYFTGIGELLVNRILIVDGVKMKFNTLTLHQRKNCLCG